MADGKKYKFDLGKSGKFNCLLSEDGKRLQVDLDVEKDGLTKTGVNGLIDALKKVRDKMAR
jgi:hypothetical protein